MIDHVFVFEQPKGSLEALQKRAAAEGRSAPDRERTKELSESLEYIYTSLGCDTQKLPNNDELPAADAIENRIDLIFEKAGLEDVSSESGSGQ